MSPQIFQTLKFGPVLQYRHPDGRYAIAQDCGIYWQETDPPEKWAVCPDWLSSLRMFHKNNCPAVNADLSNRTNKPNTRLGNYL